MDGLPLDFDRRLVREENQPVVVVVPVVKLSFSACLASGALVVRKACELAQQCVFSRESIRCLRCLKQDLGCQQQQPQTYAFITIPGVEAKTPHIHLFNELANDLAGIQMVKVEIA